MPNANIYTDGSSASLIVPPSQPITLNDEQVTRVNTALSRGMQVYVTSNGTIRVRRNIATTATTASTMPSFFYTNYNQATGTSTTSNWVVTTSATTSTTAIYTQWSALDEEINTWYNSGQPDGWTWSTNVSAALREARAPAVKKRTKNSIKRALKLMTGMGFEEEARIFLKGDTIEVSHPESLLKFVIKKYSGSLIQRTEYPGYSTPYQLQLYTKSDVHVANLCVYMEDTPVLDQVLGVAMFIKSGSEEMILRQANWSRLCQDDEIKEILALEYPYLRDKLRLKAPTYRNAEPNDLIITR